MGKCVGYIGWRTPAPVKVKETEMLDDKEGEVIWPLPVIEKQFLVYKGSRNDKDPALLVCSGKCGKVTPKWTWHEMVTSPIYKCMDCGTTRKWGFGVSNRNYF